MKTYLIILTIAFLFTGCFEQRYDKDFVIDVYTRGFQDGMINAYKDVESSLTPVRFNQKGDALYRLNQFLEVIDADKTDYPYIHQKFLNSIGK